MFREKVKCLSSLLEVVDLCPMFISLARHLIQSFDVGEVSPEVAHEIGKQFADEWLKGKYEYVIATHIDKGHCHNHIIFNAVNFVDYHSYRSNKRTYRELRQLSDAICKEHGLSVIPPSQNKGMDYKEYTEAKRGTSWKQKLRQTIDRLVITANDWDEFLKLMQEAGYEIKPGKYISFRAEGQERFTRAKTIGENYSEERLKERIAGRNPRKQQMQTERKGISLIIDIQNSIKAQESKMDNVIVPIVHALCPPICAFLSLAVAPSSKFMPFRIAFFPNLFFIVSMVSCIRRSRSSSA